MNRPSQWTAVDLLVVLVLVGTAEIALASTFEGWEYLLVAEAGALLGVLVVLATARFQVAVLVAAVPLVALVAGGPVALGSADLKSLTDVLQGAVTGWGELLTTLPWVDVAGAPALVPFLLGYLGAALAGALAVRTRSAGGPLIPLLLILAALMLLRRPGSAGSPQLDWYPVVFAVVAIGWFVVRSLRNAPGASVRGAEHGRVGRALTATLVVAIAVLVAVPLTVPRSASGSPSAEGKALRGSKAALTDLSGLDSPLRRFRTFTDQGEDSLENVYDKVLFTITGAPRNSRVRMVTLDRYDGEEWLPANNTEPDTQDDAFLRLDSHVDNPNPGRRFLAQVKVGGAYSSAWVPTVGSLTSLRLFFNDQREQRGELRYNLATSTAALPTGLGRRDPYEFTAVIPVDGVNETTPSWIGPGLQISGLRRLDDFLPKVLDAPIAPMQKVFVLAGYLRDQGRYSDGAVAGETQYQAGHDLDRLVDDFLLAGRPVGNDEQYASAMALLANRVGVPARVVVGAVLPRDGKVQGKDVHAWVELRVADGSWRTLPTKAFMSRTPPLRTLPPRPPRVPRSNRQPQQQSGPATSPGGQGNGSQAEKDRATLVRTVPFLVLLLLGLVVPAIKVVRRRLRRTRGRTSDRIAGGWAELVDRARDLGVPVEAHASRPAQARVLALSGADGLSQEADDGVFAAEEPSEAAVTAFWDQVMAERRDLRGGRGLRRRLWAPFNPVTLWRRRRSVD